MSFVLRLRQEDLVKGQLVGEMEAVSSGERRAIRNIDDMTAFCTEKGQEIEQRSI